MQTSGKKLFTLIELYRIMTLAFRSIPQLKKAKSAGKMDKAFLERIMLAVTEVNGCAMCSYYHTNVALEVGFSVEEIRAMLDGSFADVPQGQFTACSSRSITQTCVAHIRARAGSGSLRNTVKQVRSAFSP
jgi:AhpD family alkylhydroperoxidase